jgi:integrase
MPNPPRKHLPTVLTHQEATAVLDKMSGVTQWLAKLLYGSGLRLMECLRMRVKDIDFGKGVGMAVCFSRF